MSADRAARLVAAQEPKGKYRILSTEVALDYVAFNRAHPATQVALVQQAVRKVQEQVIRHLATHRLDAVDPISIHIEVSASTRVVPKPVRTRDPDDDLPGR
jgi:precorrin-3B methylase